MKQRDPGFFFRAAVILYRLACLIVSMLLVLNTPLEDYFPGILILIYLCAGTVVFVLYKKMKKVFLLIVVFIDYFYALLFPYFTPQLIMLEIIWIPVVLFTIAVFFPGVRGIFFIILMGIPGTILLGYGVYEKIVIYLNEIPYPFHMAVIPFYVLMSMLSVMACYSLMLSQKRDKQMKSLDMLNDQLNNINHSVSQKIFQLENDATNEERKRISKEIHDTAGYVFINLIMMLQAASAIFDRDSARTKNLIDDARDYAERGINEIRHILRNIRNYGNPAPISLQNEIYNIGTAFSRATEVKIDINYGNWPGTFSDNIDSFYISFMQESFTNALKHGRADSISVSCWKDDHSHSMTITDNGCGAALPVKKGIGITALEDAVSRCRGELKIRSDSTGFSVQVSIPNDT